MRLPTVGVLRGCFWCAPMVPQPARPATSNNTMGADQRRESEFDFMQGILMASSLAFL